MRRDVMLLVGAIAVAVTGMGIVAADGPELVAAASGAVASGEPAAPEGADTGADGGATTEVSSQSEAVTTAECATREGSTLPVERLSGANRFATAACAAAVGYPDGAGVVLLARADEAGQWADALAGAVLARALDGPVLLTERDRLPAETLDAIAGLGADRAVLLGGRAAIGDAVAEELAGRGLHVERVAGEDRMATAVEIANRSAPATARAYLVNGWHPADALVAAAAAARADAPLVLTDGAHVGRPTRAVLNAADEVVVVGDTAAISVAVEEDLRRSGLAVRRLGGASVGETAASVARAFPVDGQGYLVNAGALVDAVSAGWLAAAPGGGPILFVDRDAPGRAADRYLRLGGLDVERGVRLIGGTKVLSTALVDALDARAVEAQAGGPAPQMRGMWIHLFDRSLKTAAGIERVLDTATHANLNTIIVQTARRHDAYYRSDHLPRTTDPDVTADYDLLDRLVPAAHARGLQVHAWFSVMPSTHSAYAETGHHPSHVNVAHGAHSGDSWITHTNVVNYDFLEPGIAGVQEHVTRMLREVVERYDVDGIHLDYLRYESGTSGYHPTSVARYESHGEGSFSGWRRQQTRDLARRIYLEVAEADPTVVVSMAAIAQGDGPRGDDLRAGFTTTRAYADKFQDWPGWLDEGIVDMVFPMAYFDEGRHADWYDRWVRFTSSLRAPDQVVAIGQASYLNSHAQSMAQLDEAMAATDGAVLYAYQQDSRDDDNGGLIDLLGRTRWAEPAPAPTIASKVAPSAGHVLVEIRDGVHVTVTGPGGQQRRIQADANGLAGFVHLAPGPWTVTAAGSPPQAVTVRAGEVSRVAMP